MKQVLLLIGLIFAIQFGVAQEKELDSIKKLVKTYKTRDSVRVNLLNKLTRYNTARDISKNEAVLNEAITISKEVNYKQGLSDSYANLISFYVQSGKYKQALKLALETKKIQEELNDSIGVIYTNSSIARIYNHLNDSNKAIEIQLENLELLKKNPNLNIKAQVHFYLATAYTEIKKYNESEYHYKEAKKIAKKVGFKTGVAIANSSLGVLENVRKNHPKAVEYLNKSLVFFKENNQQANIANTNLELAVAYANTGELSKAILANKTAIKIYKSQNNFKNLSRAYYEQSNYYKQNKDYLNSSILLEEHYKIKDSIFSTEQMKAIEEMQTKYETDKVKQEKELAVIKSNKNRNLFIGAVLFGLFLFASSMLQFSRLKAKKKAEFIAVELKETQKRLAIEKQYKDSELKALKAQMNPHFIFNALNSIQDYIVLNQKNLASDYLGKFADLIRNYLHFSNKGFISIAEEVHNLNLYLELEKLRFEEELTYSFKIENTINSEGINIPTMLIQPYVENALKHGLLHKKNNRELAISISKISSRTIQCVIQDNGVGREKSLEINKKRTTIHKSFALKATTERLNLLNYGREKKIGVEIIDLKENEIATGTKVILQIPILKS